MKQIPILFLLVASTFSFQGWSQSNGFIGKKTFVSLDLHAFTPLIYMARTFTQSVHKTESNSNAQRSNPIDLGFNITAGRALRNHFGVALQYSQLFYDFIYRNLDGFYSYNSFGAAFNAFDVIQSSWLQGKSTTIMPILEFNNRGGLLPVGLSHQIGFGFTRHRIQNNDYRFVVPDNNSNGSLLITDNIYNYDLPAIRSTVFMYKLNLRIAINRSLLYNIGFRYNINFFGAVEDRITSEDPDFGKYAITANGLRTLIRHKQNLNLIGFETGLSYCF